MTLVYEFRSSFASYAHSSNGNVADTSQSIEEKDEILCGTKAGAERMGRCYNCISDCFYIFTLGKTMIEAFLIIVSIICFPYLVNITKRMSPYEFSTYFNHHCKQYSTLHLAFHYFLLMY